MEIVQQWQYNKDVHPELLKDEAFILAKEIGITAVQSYVPWSNIEPSEGKYDFSLYDPLVEKLEKHGMGWVPFLIFGPYYATPEWFLNSTESVPATCLEHNKSCNIQSIWNPHLRKHIDRFFNIFHQHFSKSPALKNILLGINGNWGESIFPVSGGFIEESHMHMGWWCADPYALSDFRRYLSEKYKDIRILNTEWESNFRGFDEILFPEIKRKETIKSILEEKWYRISGILPVQVKNILKSLIVKFLRIDAMPAKKSDKRWLDFSIWYRESMTKWVEFSLLTARKYFKDISIYVVTGGDGNPMQGSDFFAQAKVSAKYRAGIRVTSLSDNYPESFFLSNPAISACRFYKTYFETEEALLHNPAGITMRLFDAVSSGAKGIYFKNLIGYGKYLCT